MTGRTLDGHLYYAPCPLCSACLSEFYRSNGWPLILSPLGLRHVLVVLAYAARCQWLPRVVRGRRMVLGARETLRRLKAVRPSTSARRAPARSGLQVVVVRLRDCEACEAALAAFGEASLAMLTPRDALHVAEVLTEFQVLTEKFLASPLPKGVVTSAGVLRLGGFDPLPVEVLDYAARDRG